MFQTFKDYLVILFVFVYARAYDQGCIYEVCVCAGPYIVCEARGLTSIPPMTSGVGSYLTLNLAVNVIKDVPPGSMPSNLTGIYMQRNPITTVADTAFDGSASTLKSLYFSSALFTRIPDAFRHLKSLNELNMQDLNITDWNEEAMENIGKTLTSLYLDNVGFTSWPTWVQYFSNLSQITISTSSIASIPDDALDNLTNTLTVLTVISSQLTQVPKALSKLVALQQLFLQQNRIVDVTWLPPGSKLEVLWLNNNLISNATALCNAILPYANSLHDLYITYNRLTSIANMTFLTGIDSLDFSFNRLSDPNSGVVAPIVQVILFNHNLLPAVPRVIKTLQSITQITVAYNSIRQIQASDFHPSTTMIVLEFNLITELKDNSFPSNSKITIINLNNNPIVTISNGAFKNLGQLNELDLQGTRLTRLPLALSSLSGLYFLDMSDNSRLVCTCEEKSLEHWLLSKPTINVMGNCGLMGIHQFFSQLSPSCP